MAKRTQPHLGAAPRVDLLPEAQRAEIRHEKTLPLLLLALVGSGIIAALTWAAGMVPVLFAQQELARLQDESTQLNTEIAGYADAQEQLQAVGSRSSDRQTLTATEVLFMELRDEILARVPAGSSIVRFTATLPGIAVGEDPAAAEPLTECAANGATVTMTISSPAEGLARAAQVIEGSRGIEGFVCAMVIDSRTLSDETAAVTETQVQLVFDEAVRALRFAEGNDQ